MNELENKEIPFSIENHDDFLEISNHNKTLRIQVLNDNLIRFRYKTKSRWERDFSYALDPALKILHKTTKIVDQKNLITLSTNTLNIFIDKVELLVTIKDKDGFTISEDKNLQFEENYEKGSNKIKIEKKIFEGEHFYGLGDKPCHPDLRGNHLTIWSTDNYGYYDYTDPLYKSIPFFIGLHHLKSYGIFIDNTYRITLDFGKEEIDNLKIDIDGGELNYYFIYGPEMIDVSRRYTWLTGVPELPPLWALGYQQCKWSYSPESEVHEICNRLREEKIPCDVIYLDIDYMDGFRCFTFDKEKFPNPKKMITALKNNGFKTVVIIDPGIKIDEDYSIYKQGIENGYFCKAGEGGLISGKVWPGECYFPDFTNPEVREWWASLFQDLIIEKGVAGIWNDMNEPALFEVPNKTFPDTVRHHNEGEECGHNRVHNVYGMLMTRASYEGVKNFSYPNRPFLLTRATFSGGQKYSAGWTGDNIACWEHISIANYQTQRLSISGFSFVGSDIGGFIDQPTAELFCRYMGFAIMHPFFRNHSSGDHGNQEPWAFDQETLEIVRNFIEIRYKLLPYIYTSFYQYIKEFTPILRPSYMVYQDDFHTHYRGDEVMFGDSLLFAPIHEEDSLSKSIYFPKGLWYHFYTDEVFIGNKENQVNTPINESCLFVKEGTMLPMYPVMNYVGEKKIEILHVNLYFSKNENDGLFLYEDNGENYDYKDGAYNEVRYVYRYYENYVEISQNRTGKFTPDYDSYLLNLIGFPPIEKIIGDDHVIETTQIKLSRDFKSLKIYLK